MDGWDPDEDHFASEHVDAGRKFAAQGGHGASDSLLGCAVYDSHSDSRPGHSLGVDEHNENLRNAPKGVGDPTAR